MALTFSSLTGGTATSTSAPSTASVSPAANRLTVVTVPSLLSSGTTPNQPTLSGNGRTYVAITTQTFSDGFSYTARVTKFRALHASPSAGAIAISFASQTQNVVCWSVEESSAEVDTSGTNGSGAIVQSAVNSGSGTAPSATLAAFGDATNNAAVIGVACAALPRTISLEASPWVAFTQRNALNSSELSVRTGYRTGADTSPSGTISATGNEWAVIALEIKASTGTTVQVLAAPLRSSARLSGATAASALALVTGALRGAARLTPALAPSATAVQASSLRAAARLTGAQASSALALSVAPLRTPSRVTPATVSFVVLLQVPAAPLRSVGRLVGVSVGSAIALSPAALRAASRVVGARVDHVLALQAASLRTAPRLGAATISSTIALSAAPLRAAPRLISITVVDIGGVAFPGPGPYLASLIATIARAALVQQPAVAEFLSTPARASLED